MQLPRLSRKSLVNLTPLIDVVFILLIFFMLASNFIKWKSLELSVTEPEEIIADQQKISFIQIQQNGLYSLNDNVLSLEEIMNKVKQRSLVNQDHPVIIQPGKGSALQLMVDALENLQRISVSNISLAKPEDISTQ